MFILFHSIIICELMLGETVLDLLADIVELGHGHGFYMSSPCELCTHAST